jgi:hypothetical protein
MKFAISFLPRTEIPTIRATASRASPKSTNGSHLKASSRSGSACRSRRDRIGQKVARFRQINLEQPNVHHDALEFPEGQVVLLTQLDEGQHATVLQLPASPRATNEAEQQKRDSVVA